MANYAIFRQDGENGMFGKAWCCRGGEIQSPNRNPQGPFVVLSDTARCFSRPDRRRTIGRANGRNNLFSLDLFRPLTSNGSGCGGILLQFSSMRTLPIGRHALQNVKCGERLDGECVSVYMSG
jgi:hypothetical protein